MASSSYDHHDDTELSISTRGTQFIYRDGDEDDLWEVVEITGERGTEYKVKWAGLDPRTGEPWAESWVSKRDCTNDLVQSWKITKALNKKLKKEKTRKSSYRNAPTSSSANTSHPLPNAKAGKIKLSRFAPSESSVQSNLKHSIADNFDDDDVPKRKKRKTLAHEVESEDDTSRADAQLPKRKRRAQRGPSKKADEDLGRDHDEELAVAQLALPSEAGDSSEVNVRTTRRNDLRKRKAKALEKDVDATRSEQSGRDKPLSRPAVTLEVANGHNPPTLEKQSSKRNPKKLMMVVVEIKSKLKRRRDKEVPIASNSAPSPEGDDEIHDSSKLEKKPRRKRKWKAVGRNADIFDEHSGSDSNEELSDVPRSADKLAAIPKEEISNTLDEGLSQKSSNTDLPWPPFKLSERAAVSHHPGSRSPSIHSDPPVNVENEDIGNDARPSTPLETPPKNEHVPAECGIAPSAPLSARKGPPARNHPLDDSIVPPTETQSSSSSLSPPPSAGIGGSFGDAVTHDDAPKEQRILIDVPIQPSSNTRLPSLTSLMKQSKSSIRSLKRPTTPSPSRPLGSPPPQPRSPSLSTGELLDENCSADATAGTSSRPIGPLPVCSPSKFKPYLSAEDDDTVEDFSTAAVASAGLDDEDYLPSSIEQFSSPYPKRNERRHRRLYRLRKPSGDDGDENNDGDEMRNIGVGGSGDDDDDEIRRKGEKLAALAALKKAKEKVKRIRKPLVLPEHVGFKETVEEIPVRTGEYGAFMDNRGTILEEVSNQESMNDYEEDGHDEEEIAQLEKDFIDLTGGAQYEDNLSNVGGNINPLPLRMEEEENTQDLLLEMEAFNATRKEAIPNGLALTQDFPASSPVCADPNAILPQVGPSLTSLDPTRHYDAEAGQNFDDMLPLPVSNANNSPKLRTSGSPESQADVYPSARAITPGANFEIPQQTVPDEVSEVDLLKEKVSDLEELLRNSTTAMSTATATLAAMQINFAAEKAVWEDERTRLISNNELLISERASSQKDIALFRELYGAASAHADTLTSDKLVLEKRIEELTELLTIAENQVQGGFTGVKTFFEWRVRALEGEVERWKDLCHIFKEKEIRAGNLIRNTVDEAEGLRDKVRKLKSKLKGLKQEIETRNVILGRRPRKSKDAALPQIILGEVDPNGEDEEIYRCVWMPAGGNTYELCEQVFIDIKDLEVHTCRVHLNESM